MSASEESRVKSPSLFNLVKQRLNPQAPLVSCTKATLVHLSHTLEDMVLSRKIPAIIFTGFQESSYWQQETGRYQALAQIAQQVCIFSGGPLPPESEAASIHVTLSSGDPLRQEWFLVILSESLAVILCGQDKQIATTEEATRQFETLWSFEPQLTNVALDVLEEIVAGYRPEKLVQLQEVRYSHPAVQTDLALLTEFTLQLVRFEEMLNQRYQKTESLLQQHQTHLEIQVAERTDELTAMNQRLQHEISERQQAEMALAEDHNLLRTLLDNLPDQIYVKDKESRFVLANAATLKILRMLNLDELAGKCDFDLNPPELAAKYYRDEQTVIHSEQPLLGEEEINIDPVGQQRWFSTTKVPLRDGQGKIIGLVGMSRDITSRKQIEAELQRYRDHLEDLVIERTSHLRAANQNLQREITECQRAEAERERLLAAEQEQRLLAETIREVTLALTSQMDHTAVLDEILRQAQRLVPCSALHIVLLQDNILRMARWQGYQAFGCEDFIAHLTQPINDFLISKRVIESRTALVIPDTHQESTWIVIEETSWIRANLIIPICLQERVLGMLRLDSDTPGQFSEQDAQRLQSLAGAAAIALSNAQLYAQTQKQARQMQQILDSVEAGLLLLDTNYRIILANPAGRVQVAVLAGAEIGQTLTHLGNKPLEDVLALPRHSYYHEVTPADAARPIFEVVARPVMGAPQTEGWVLVLRDVTEERDAQKRMQQQEKLAAVGQLAAGIAHDFNNILTSIIGSAELARTTPDLPGAVQGDLNQIVKQGQRAAHLVRQILDFARQNAGIQRSLEFSQFLKDIVDLLERTIPETIQIELEIEPYHEAYTVKADPSQLQQVLTNLAVNAVDAMPAGGTLRFHLSKFTLMSNQRPPYPGMASGDWLTLVIADTGVGIPLEIQAHIFEPFFTTKEIGQGTGLGLAQADGIIKHHGGYINVESEVDRGTTFTIFLPTLQVSKPVSAEDTQRQKPQGRSQTILLVEDNLAVLMVVSAMLERMDYEVLTATNGREALELCYQHQDSIALVITDLAMPEMDGLTLARMLQTSQLHPKILAITGYPLKMVKSELSALGIVDWLEKPIDLDLLAYKLEQVLPKKS